MFHLSVRSVLATVSLASGVFSMSGCMASGTWSAEIPDQALCSVPDADQIQIVYQNPYVPNYLTVSINNDQFVFDECAPDSTQNDQGDFAVTRGSGTVITVGLRDSSTLRSAYFSGFSPIRSDLTIKIMGRQSCYQSPTTIVPTNTIGIGWTATTASGGSCSVDGYAGTAYIN